MTCLRQHFTHLHGRKPGWRGVPIAGRGGPGTLTAGEWEGYLAEVEAGATGGHRGRSRTGRCRGAAGAKAPWTGYRPAPGFRQLDGLLPLGTVGRAVRRAAGQHAWQGMPMPASCHNTHFRSWAAQCWPERCKTRTHAGNAPSMVWYSDIEVIPLGRGRLVFCQYRAFDRARTNPVAARLACNLLRVAQRGD